MVDHRKRLNKILKDINENRMENSELLEICKLVVRIKKRLKEESAKIAHNTAVRKYSLKKRYCEPCNREYSIRDYYEHVKSNKHIKNEKNK